MNVIGHRGASASAPENTPEAFALANRMGADGVELDVRIAPDGRGGDRLVVFHDPLPADQSAIDELPTFDDVLRACGERMLVNVEIKNSDEEGGHDPTMAVVAPTVASMRRLRTASTRWLFSSFDIDTIDHCRRIAPDIPTAFLVMEADDRAIARAVAGGHCAIHPWERSLSQERVAACHAAGLVVNTWTCNDPNRIVELSDMGVDGVCTDVPDEALRALGRDEVDLTPDWGTPA